MTAATLNRKARLAMAANAKPLAVKLSRTAMDYDQRGSIVRVSHQLAQDVLARAFERMLRAGVKPQVLRITEAEAAAFPRGGRVPSPGAEPWLAVGVDRAGSATYALRWLGSSCTDPAERRAAAEIALRAVLAVECDTAGFPVAGHA
jgi:hypothetical protein